MELEEVQSDLLALRQLYGLLQNIGQGLQSISSENVSSLISKQSITFDLSCHGVLTFKCITSLPHSLFWLWKKLTTGMKFFLNLFLNFNFSPQALRQYTLFFCTPLCIVWFDYRYLWRILRMCKEISIIVFPFLVDIFFEWC